MHVLPRLRKTRARSSGFSLLEVVLSLAILAGALGAIGILVDVGLRHSQIAQAQTEAQLLCETKMAELTAGVAAVEPVFQAPLEGAIAPEGEDPGLYAETDWIYTIEVNPVDGPAGLVSVKLTVEQDPAQFARPVGFSLVRWMPDPGVVAPEDPTAEDPAATGTTSAGASGTSGAAPTGGSSSQGATK